MPAIILGLIAQFGIPLAKQIYDIVTSKMVDGKPTPEMWDALLAAENKSAADFDKAISGT